MYMHVHKERCGLSRQLPGPVLIHIKFKCSFSYSKMYYVGFCILGPNRTIDAALELHFEVFAKSALMAF